MFHAVGSSLRPLAKHPGFTGVAVLSLALGIGVNAIIFSLVDSAILRPLPFSDVGRVVRLFAADDRNVKDADRRAFVLLGRLAPDTTLEQAQLEMDALARRLDLAGPSSNQSLRMALVSELDYTGIGDAGDNKALAYLVLLLVLLVLFVACNNVSGLLLARAEARRPGGSGQLAKPPGCVVSEREPAARLSGRRQLPGAGLLGSIGPTHIASSPPDSA